MATDEIKYSEAMAEIEKILAGLQSGECDIDALGKNVKRASELIAICRNRLLKAEAEVKAVLEEK